MEPIFTDCNIVRRILGALVCCGADIADVFKATGYTRLTDVPPEEYENLILTAWRSTQKAAKQ